MLVPALAQQSSKTLVSIGSIVLSICFAVEHLDAQLSTRIGLWWTRSSRQFRTTFVLVDLCRILGIVSRLGPLGRTSLVLHCRLKGQRRGRREALSWWGESRNVLDIPFSQPVLCRASPARSLHSASHDHCSP